MGFALLLKFFELDARFPRDASELPPAAVQYVAEQVAIDPDELGRYDWAGRSIKYHRAQIRDALGFREATRSLHVVRQRSCRAGYPPSASTPWKSGSGASSSRP